ncbi:MAG: hypothetical protein SFY81_15355 [Verrucomicrobiota bacterium]|nr:hypothetical protein [Verrucomicrobiota bacterium]
MKTPSKFQSLAQWLLLIAFIVCATFSLNAEETHLAQVANLRGAPTILGSDGKWQRLKAGDTLSRGSKIKTGKQDSVDLVLKSSRRLVGIAPNSIVQFDDKGVFLQEGQLVGSIRKDTLAASFRTETGSLNVNGGDFLLNANNQAVEVLSGAAEISSPQLPAVSIVKAGQSRTFNASSTGPAEKLSEPQVNQLLNRVDLLVSSRASVSETFQQEAATYSYSPPCPPQVSPEPCSQGHTYGCGHSGSNCNHWGCGTRCNYSNNSCGHWGCGSRCNYTYNCSHWGCGTRCNYTSNNCGHWGCGTRCNYSYNSCGHSRCGSRCDYSWGW